MFGSSHVILRAPESLSDCFKLDTCIPGQIQFNGGETKLDKFSSAVTALSFNID